jgi:hypothetical protein
MSYLCLDLFHLLLAQVIYSVPPFEAEARLNSARRSKISSAVVLRRTAFTLFATPCTTLKKILITLYLNNQSVPQREHHTSLLQRKTG